MAVQIGVKSLPITATISREKAKNRLCVSISIVSSGYDTNSHRNAKNRLCVNERLSLTLPTLMPNWQSTAMKRPKQVHSGHGYAHAWAQRTKAHLGQQSVLRYLFDTQKQLDRSECKTGILQNKANCRRAAQVQITIDVPKERPRDPGKRRKNPGRNL
jgi:hypothetical protein